MPLNDLSQLCTALKKMTKRCLSRHPQQSTKWAGVNLTISIIRMTQPTSDTSQDKFVYYTTPIPLGKGKVVQLKWPSPLTQTRENASIPNHGFDAIYRGRGISTCGGGMTEWTARFLNFFGVLSPRLGCAWRLGSFLRHVCRVRTQCAVLAILDRCDSCRISGCTTN